MSFWKGLLAGLFGKVDPPEYAAGETRPTRAPPTYSPEQTWKPSSPQPQSAPVLVEQPGAKKAEPLSASSGLSALIVEHGPVQLSGAADYQDGIELCDLLREVFVYEDQERAGGYVFELSDGTAIGRISHRSAIAKKLSDSEAIIRAWVTGYGGEDDKGRLLPPRVKIVTGPIGAQFELPKINPPKAYPVGLVGEQNYQAAVRALVVGETVKLLSEPKNQFDDNAIVAVNVRGQTLGYVPKANWLYDAINNEGQGAEASVKFVGMTENGFWNVVIDVVMNGQGIGVR